VSALANISDQIRGQLQSGVSKIRSQLFGANNERLDFLMDSFYKLSAPQQSAVFAGLVGVVGFFVLLALGLYFSQVAGLKNDLNQSFAALHELEALKAEYQREDARFDRLSEQVQKRTADLRIKPFFERIGNEQGAQIEGLTEQRVALPETDALSKSNIQEVKVDLRLNNISIPRVLNFIAEVEKANNFVRIQDLTIQARFGNRLFFDTTIKARGYATR